MINIGYVAPETLTGIAWTPVWAHVCTYTHLFIAVPIVIALPELRALVLLHILSSFAI